MASSRLFKHPPPRSSPAAPARESCLAREAANERSIRRHDIILFPKADRMPHGKRSFVALVRALLPFSMVLLHPAALLAQAAPAEAAPANADEANQARQAFQAGQQAFAEGRFEEAAQSFEEAFRIKPHANPLVNA